MVVAFGSERVSASAPDTFDQAFELFAKSCKDPEQSFSEPDRLQKLGWTPLQTGMLPEFDEKVDRVKKQASDEPGLMLNIRNYQMGSTGTDALLSITTQTDGQVKDSTCSIYYPRIAKIPPLADLNTLLGKEGEDWSKDPSDMIVAESFRSYNWESPWPEIWSVRLSYLPPDHAKVYVFGSEMQRGLILSAEK